MAIEGSLSPRYQIRKLGPEHSEWVCAIIAHCNVFSSPLWTARYTEGLTARCYETNEKSKYLVDHQINSGLSFGIFDLEYQFRRPESTVTGGKLYWNEGDLDADSDKLLEQMDFPLLSVALAYDSHNSLDREKMAPRIAMQPEALIIYKRFTELDQRDPASWQADGPGQVLFRNATATKVGEEGKGFMKALAYHLMRESAKEGFRAIAIDCAHAAVAKVWSNPPAPFKADVVTQFNTFDLEVINEAGEKTYPLRPANVDITKILLHLKA
ncbi:hypothetical protein BX600DRAFT_457126 [Xylariales sp. PMI_506]|nr:hypothetical protein BX600DRAFT_457126 [Xylariales sp. PMI_506]